MPSDSTILDATRRLVRRNGAITVDQLGAEVNGGSGEGAVQELRVALRDLPQIHWLDEEGTWLWTGSRKGNRVLHAIEKILSVARSIEVESLCEGVRRIRTLREWQMPHDIVATLCVESDLCHRDGDRLVATSTVREWRVLLGRYELALVHILTAHGPTLERKELRRHARHHSGVNIDSLGAWLRHSPILEQHGKHHFRLRGVPEGAAKANGDASADGPAGSDGAEPDDAPDTTTEAASLRPTPGGADPAAASATVSERAAALDGAPEAEDAPEADDAPESDGGAGADGDRATTSGAQPAHGRRPRKGHRPGVARTARPRTRQGPQRGIRVLPRGRHGLAPEVVAENQRQRILAAMVETVADRGYADATIAEAVGAARVSRKTFYELFTDKDSCFAAACERWLGELMRVTREGFESSPEEPWAERIRLAMRGLLEHIAGDPIAARAFVVEAAGAGPAAIARRDATVRDLAALVDMGRSAATQQPPGITSVVLIGGVEELVRSRILHGATAQLPTLLPDVVFCLAQPLLGTEAAAAERERTRRALAEDDERDELA